HNFIEGDIDQRVRQLPQGVDLEALLVGSSLRPLFRDAIRELDPNVPDTDPDLLTFARDHKEETAV
ncbi:hypothetical protein LTR94_032605, partial [Friedmanniomyces endolithicus]